MKPSVLCLIISCSNVPALAELRVPAFTAYTAPDPNGAKVSKERGVSAWTRQGKNGLWYGQ